jgi:hypothetical protein
MADENVKLVEAKLAAMPNFVALGLKIASIGHRPGTGLLGECFVLSFSNENMRSVQVIYHPREGNKDYFLVNLVNDESKDVFNVEDWLKKNDAIEKVDPFMVVLRKGWTRL